MSEKIPKGWKKVKLGEINELRMSIYNWRFTIGE